MIRRALLAVLATLAVCAPAQASVGPTEPGSVVDSNSAGQGEAYRTTASESGPVDRLSVYLDGASTATRAEVGLYSDTGSDAGTRLGACVIAEPIADAWNRCSLASAASVTSGTRYWLSILQPTGTPGVLKYRTSTGSGAAYWSSQSSLAALPESWSSGTGWGAQTLSAYADLATVVDPDPTPTPTPTPTPGPTPDPSLPPLGQPSCVSASASASSSDEIRAALSAGQNVCVTGIVGDIDLSNLTLGAVRTLGTSGAGSIGAVRIGDSANLTIQARFRSIKITLSNHITIQQSRIGGTPANRILDTLIFVAEPSDDVTIRDNDIGWTTSDNAGDTGFGIRVYNDSDNLTIQRNYIHHLGSDGMQVSIEGDNALIDRNEVAYAARPPNGDEHSDDLQMAGQGPNNRVTNNYFHHCGWWTETGPQTGCNALAIHAGSTGAFLYENNYQGDALGIPNLGDLGTGGCVRSNMTFRNNTWFRNGTQFSSGEDVSYAFCGGSNNLFERNLTIDNFGNKYGFAASGTTARSNLDGAGYTLDPVTRDCTSAACNPADGPIGYRKPPGVHW